MLWLREQGHSVIGAELSSLACEAFFAENGIEYELTQKDGFSYYSSERLRIICGNYFDLDRNQSWECSGDL